MVGLSTLMDHRHDQRLADALADLLDTAFPVVSALVGMLGVRHRRSNNSNVLFALLQEEVALLIRIAPGLLVASQTTGGALGSMIAPAKIIVGCSTAGLGARRGRAARHTALRTAIGLGMGALALVASLGEALQPVGLGVVPARPCRPGHLVRSRPWAAARCSMSRRR